MTNAPSAASRPRRSHAAMTNAPSAASRTRRSHASRTTDAPRTHRRTGRALVAVLIAAAASGISSVASAQTVDGEVDALQLAEALERYANEPRVEDLLAHVDDDDAYDPESVQRLVRRARRGGWLPQVRVGVRRGRTQDLSTQTTSTRVSTDDDLVLDASLTLRFDRAAYGPDEVSLAREARARAEARDARARLVVAAYFERRRLQLERDLLGRRDLGTSLRIAELGALLDALTSGAFSRLRRRARRVEAR
jgi:hypothetical protein